MTTSFAQTGKFLTQYQYSQLICLSVLKKFLFPAALTLINLGGNAIILRSQLRSLENRMNMTDKENKYEFSSLRKEVDSVKGSVNRLIGRMEEYDHKACIKVPA